MGMECPECGKRSAVVATITANGEGARKAEDVIAYRLACGHTVGGEEYTDFVKKCQEIDVNARTHIQHIQEGAQSQKAALWKEISDAIEEGEYNAE